MVNSDSTLSDLIDKSQAAQTAFFAHHDPGNLRPAQKRAFQYTNTALLLLWKAAQMELEAELELHVLISSEGR